LRNYTPRKFIVGLTHLFLYSEASNFSCKNLTL